MTAIVEDEVAACIREIREFAAVHGCHWHEPDEQEVSAFIVGRGIHEDEHNFTEDERKDLTVFGGLACVVLCHEGVPKVKAPIKEILKQAAKTNELLRDVIAGEYFPHVTWHGTHLDNANGDRFILDAFEQGWHELIIGIKDRHKPKTHPPQWFNLANLLSEICSQNIDGARE